MLNLHYTPDIWPFAASVAITVGLYLLTRRRPSERVTRLFGWLLLSISWWTACYLLEVASSTLQGKLLWSSLKYAGAASAPLFYLALACRLTGRSTWLKPLWRVGGGVAIAIVAMVWTNPWHGLYWTSVTIAPGSPETQSAHGPLFLVYELFTYFGAISSIALFVRHAFAVRPRARAHAILLALASIVLIAGRLADVAFGFDPFPRFDNVILLLLVSSVLFAVAIFGFGALDLVGTAQRIVMEDIQTPILLLDLERRVVGANPFATVLLGLEEARLPRPIEDVWPGWPKDPLQPIGEVRIELLGEAFYFSAQESSIPGPDGSAMGTVVVLTDVTERKALEERLADLAARDPLTHAWNRRAFEEQAVGKIQGARRHGESVSLALCDLDLLKLINDRNGHVAGDRALVAFHDACASELRADDLLARLGGDEFAVLLVGSGFDETSGVLERLRQAVERARVDQEPEVKMTMSLGAVHVDDVGALASSWGVSELLEEADRALYESKEQRNRCTVRHLEVERLARLG